MSDEHSQLDERGLPRGRPFLETWETTPRDVKRRLDEGDPSLVLLDCRRDDERDHCVIGAPGEVFIPMDQTASRLDELETHKNRSVVVYCHTGRRSLRVAALLRDHGFQDVKSLAGGIDLWSVDIDPTVPRY